MRDSYLVEENISFSKIEVQFPGKEQQGLFNVFYINTTRTILLLPEIKCEGHLGFEIYEHNKLIGFTYDYSFIDTNTYASDYIHEYKKSQKSVKDFEKDQESKIAEKQLVNESLLKKASFNIALEKDKQKQTS